MSGPNAEDLRAKVFEDGTTPGDWRVEKMDDDVGYDVVNVFTGSDAREQVDVRWIATVRPTPPPTGGPEMPDDVRRPAIDKWRLPSRQGRPGAGAASRVSLFDGPDRRADCPAIGRRRDHLKRGRTLQHCAVAPGAGGEERRRSRGRVPHRSCRT
jgi:hypothetical protein